jgi:1,4-alpha-glucan branching enzyme
VREALLALSSDWAFMVTKDSAADYARRRAARHGARVTELATALRAGRPTTGWSGPFGHLDARGLRKDGPRFTA